MLTLQVNNLQHKMSRESSIYKTTIIGGIGNLCLVIFKLVAGIVGHSAAMIADGIHSVSDFVTDIIVLVFVKISSRPRDDDHKYGHGKYETLATALIGIVLLGVGIGIFWHGVAEIWDIAHGAEVKAAEPIALIAALVSIVVKEILYQYTARVGRAIKSDVLVANAWHHRSDAFSSIATAIGIGGALILGGKWIILDPIAACLVSILIVKSAFTLSMPSINELLEKSLPPEQEQAILDILRSTPDVYDPHNLRTRKIGPICSVDVHIRMHDNCTVLFSHETTRAIEAKIRQLLGADTIINIHVEPMTSTRNKKN